MDSTREAAHPGAILLSELIRRGMKQKELAIRAGVSEKHISTVINGTKDVSPSFARKLDIALGDEAGVWAGRQAEYDDYMAVLKERENVKPEEFDILAKLKDVVACFLEEGIMHNHCGEVQKILQLRKILCVHELSVIPQITYNAAYRAMVKTSTNIDAYILFAWQRMCEILTESDDVVVPFDKEKLVASVPEIRKQTFETSPNFMIANLKAIFAKCGVAFAVVPHFRGAPVQGFIKKTGEDKVILCVTIRGKRADRFWFSLFHEVGHLANGDIEARFVDFDSVNSEMETKADIFARDKLIDPARYRKFVDSQRFRNLRDIKSFSKIVGVPHWIVVGRLHNDEWLDWSYFANEAPSFEWGKTSKADV